MRLTGLLTIGILVPCLVYACGGAADDGDKNPDGSDAGGQGGNTDADGQGGNGPTDDPIPCRSDKVCTPFDLLCDTERSLCVECLVADDCSGDAICQAGSCLAITPCDSSKDCGSAQVCDDALGYCVECVGNNDCADGQICAATTCHDSCASSKECAANDQVCGDAGYCVDCEGNNDCADGSACSNNVCVATTCEADATSCAGSDLLTCRADGSGFDSVTCDDGCTEDSAGASCDGVEPSDCAGGTANPCSSIPKFLGTQTVDGDPEDFCDIPYKTLNVGNAAFVGGPTGAPIDASTIDSNSSAQIRMAWSASALHVHIHVVDPLLRVTSPTAEYNGDNVQLFIQGAAPAGGSTLYGGSTAGVVTADVSSEPQQIFLVPAAGATLGSSRFTVPWTVSVDYDWATRATSDGYDIELSYPWPAAVAPMTAERAIGLDLMVGVNDDPALNSTREFEYGLYLGSPGATECPSYPAPWCDNVHWCTPTTAN